MDLIYCKFKKVGINKFKCEVCGFPVESPHPINKIICNCTGPSLSIQLPKLTEDLNEVYQRISVALREGYGHVSKEQYKSRLKICGGCLKLNAQNECNSKRKDYNKFYIPVKLRKKAFKCPLGKWRSKFRSSYKGEMSLFYNVEGTNVFLKNHYKNSSIFFLGAGPSLLDLDLASLKQRGIITFGVNNLAAKLFRPNLWTCVDTPLSFHESIFRDPAITKFIAGIHTGSQFTTENRGRSELVVKQCPNVIHYDMNDLFEPDIFFEQDTVCWGNAENVTDCLGLKSGRSVMLPTIKIMAYLGFKRIYLLGCDFNMQYDPEKKGTGKTYAFRQYKNQKACDDNNKGYIRLAKRLAALLPGLEFQNIKVYNCNELSNLKVFSYKSFDDCKKEALKNFPAKITTQGLYK